MCKFRVHWFLSSKITVVSFRINARFKIHIRFSSTVSKLEHHNSRQFRPKRGKSRDWITNHREEQELSWIRDFMVFVRSQITNFYKSHITQAFWNHASQIISLITNICKWHHSSEMYCNITSLITKDLKRHKLVLKLHMTRNSTNYIAFLSNRITHYRMLQLHTIISHIATFLKSYHYIGKLLKSIFVNDITKLVKSLIASQNVVSHRSNRDDFHESPQNIFNFLPR